MWLKTNDLRSSKTGNLLQLTLQAYIDESYEENGIFVMAGYIASVESWAAFTKDWEKMLPYGMLNNEGEYYFKMSDMAQKDERMKRVPAFFRIIEEHVLGFVSVKIDISELKRVLSRLSVPGAVIDWEMHANPYYIAFRCLLDMFHLHRPKMTDAIPLNEKIDFIFDDRTEEKAIISSWDYYMENRPEEVRQYYGSVPRFENDEEFLPLQAADFWAWWVRKWHKDGTTEKIRECDFGSFKLRGLRKYLKIDISFNEDQLVSTFKRILGRETDRPIYDAKEQ